MGTNPETAGSPGLKDAGAMLRTIWGVAGGDPAWLDAVKLSGALPVQPSSFKVDELAMATIAAQSLAAAAFHAARGGERQQVAVAADHAAADFWNERLLRIDGEDAPELWDPIAGAYQCGDGRHVRIHTNFPHHRDGILEILDCANDRDAVSAALQRWTAAEFEEVASAKGMIAAMMRSEEEWQSHGQGKALSGRPVLTVERIGDAPPRPSQPGARPLDGIRVLDLTRIIAGPTCGRALSSHGATVMRIASPWLPYIPLLVMATGQGKHSAHLDLKTEAGKAGLERLLGEADVFVSGYRPGALGGFGFDPVAIAGRHPGIVAVSLSAYGTEGPWGGKRGFDSIVQTACGINHSEALAAGQDGPRPLPCQALDHGAGQLLALGAMTALKRQRSEGGSWHVRVCLAGVADFLMKAGKRQDGFAIPARGREDFEEFLVVHDGPAGRITSVSPAGRLSATPARWDRAPVPLGHDLPVWPGIAA